MKSLFRVCWKTQIIAHFNLNWANRTGSKYEIVVDFTYLQLMEYNFIRLSWRLSFHVEIRQRSASPANLTRLSTMKMQAIQVSLVPFNLPLIRFNPYPVLACPNLPSIGLRSPGLIWWCNADGLPSGLASSFMPFSFNAARLALVQYIWSASNSFG